MGTPSVHEKGGVSGTRKEGFLGIRTEGKVEPDRGDGRNRIERDHTSEVREGEYETQRAQEPHWCGAKREILRSSSALAIPFRSEEHDEKGRTATIGGVSPTVDFAYKLGPRERAVSAKRVHQARVGCYRKRPAKKA